MNVFKSENGNVVLNIPYCEFCIPKYYFDENKKYAEDYGETINVLGIFYVNIFENGKFKELKTFNFPVFNSIRVYEYEERVINVNDENKPCRVYKYYKGNIIMSEVIVEDDNSAKSYLSMLLSASLPKTIPYNMALNVWRKNLELSNVNFGVSSAILELIIAIVHRNPNNMYELFSKVVGKNPDMSQYDYALASIRQICQYTSTFSGIVYEDIDTMITTAINRARDGIEEPETPLEKIIKM